jgi:DNA-binding NarL/FixJ family response regulator
VNRIRVLIVDDHLLVADALSTAFRTRPEIEIAGVARTGLEGVELAISTGPDVVLIDFRLPDINGAEVVRRIRAQSAARCVILTGTGQERAMVEAIEAGADGFLTKDQRFEVIANAVIGVANGQASFEPTLLAKALPGLRGGSAGSGRFTTREREVLDCLAYGSSNAEIADRLYLSVNTVRNHVANLLVKLDAKTRGEAVAFALRDGLVSRPE